MPNSDLFYTVIPPKDQKLRGVIIADSSVIFPLSGLVKDEFIAKDEAGRGRLEQLRCDEQAHYINTLNFLSDHGYAVIIPAMVAYECAQALFTPMGGRRGALTSVAEMVFDHDLDACQDMPYKWFQDIAGSHAHRDCWIAPPHGDDHSVPAKFMRDIDRIALRDDCPDEQRKDNVVNLDRKRRRDRDNAIHYGDIAAQELLRVLDVPEGVPVFYLAGDMFAHIDMANVRKDVEIGKLNITGFMDALENERLLPHIGFAEGTTSRMLVEHMYQEFSKNSGRGSAIPRPTDVSYSPENNDITAKAFQKSLAGLAKELDEMREDIAAARKEAPGKYLERYKEALPSADVIRRENA
jgi:hypothetical protein